MIRIAATLVLLAVAGCFTPSHDRCAVSCAADQSCPRGFSCLSDGFCHASPSESLCAINNSDGGVDAPIDAGPGCGDGVRQTDQNEECDDDNGDDGDGCSAICREESGFVCAGGPGELSVCRPNPSQAGDLVITELLIDPNTNDLAHEWIEIHNPTATDFDLRDMLIESEPIETFTVTQPLPLPAGAHIVFGPDDDMDTNGGAPVTLAYGSAIRLANNNFDEFVQVSFAGVVIDRVEPPTTATTGAALSLDPDTYDAVSNDDNSNFCDATEPFGDDNNLGTPGMLNTDCP